MVNSRRRAFFRKYYHIIFFVWSVIYIALIARSISDVHPAVWAILYLVAHDRYS